MYELLEIDKDKREEILAGSFEDVTKEKSADVVIICTDSFVKDSFKKIKHILEKKITVISTAEEMAYPKISNEKPDIKLTRSLIVSNVKRSTDFIKVAKGEVVGSILKDTDILMESLKLR